MKKMLVIFALMMSIAGVSFANNNPNSLYKLYPTDNIWTFMKLNTATGQVWQVHFSVDKKGSSGELSVIYEALTSNPSKDRFELYKTSNMYNFILIDSVDGRMWQVQWSFDDNKRGIVRALN